MKIKNQDTESPAFICLLHKKAEKKPVSFFPLDQACGPNQAYELRMVLHFLMVGKNKKKRIAFSDMCNLRESQISVSLNKSSLGTQLCCVLSNGCFHSARADLRSWDRDQAAGKAQASYP